MHNSLDMHTHYLKVILHIYLDLHIVSEDYTLTAQTGLYSYAYAVSQDYIGNALLIKYKKTILVFI